MIIHVTVFLIIRQIIKNGRLIGIAKMRNITLLLIIEYLEENNCIKN